MSAPADAGAAATAESSTCHTCGVAIATAQFIRVGAYKFHKDHFTCCVCQTSLHGKKFHHKEGKFYCANDYVDKFCHTCRHCKQKIATGSVIQAFGGYYHPEHFVCKTCSKPFPNGKYYEAGDEPYCLAEGTPIARAHGCSVAIEQATELDTLLSWAETSGAVVHAAPSRHIKRGIKPCVELQFADGRTLVCTPDHRLRTTDGAWMQAIELQEHHSAVFAAAVPPLALAHEDQRSCEQWQLDAAGDHSSLPAFSMRSPAERERALALARLLGYTCALPLSAPFPSLSALDAAALLHDAHLLDPSGVPNVDVEPDSCCAPPLPPLPTLPATVAAILACFTSSSSSSLSPLSPSSSASPSSPLLLSLPAFLCDPACPLPLVREFLAALMGRHALPPAHAQAQQQCTAMLLPAVLAPVAEQLRVLLARFGVEAYCDAVAAAASSCSSSSLAVPPASLLAFNDTIGLRFASLAAQRLALAAAFQRAQGCFPKAEHVRSFTAFLTECGPQALHAFSDAASPAAPLSPFSLRLVSRRSVGDRPVFDLSVPATRCVLSNGLTAHNCDEHYFLITAEKCASCGDGVKDADMVRVQGKVFHSHCLACCHCGLPLARKGSIFQKDGNVYCRSDYLNFFCKRCTACSEHILRHCISVNDEFYHPDCLKCSACSKKLDKYICISGSLRCNEHTELGVEPIRCSQCTKLIDGEVVLSVGMKLHPDCFRCAQCQKPLAKATAKLKDDKQLCCPECMLKKDPSLRARNAAAALADAQKGVGASGAEEIDDASALASIKGPSSTTSRASSASSSTASPKSVAAAPGVVVDHDAFTKYTPKAGGGHGKKASRALPGGKIEWKKGELIGKGSFGKVYMAMNCLPAADHELLTDEGFMGYDAFRARVHAGQTVNVACPRLDGSMEFHPVDLARFVESEGVHQHVLMQSTDSASSVDAKQQQQSHLDLMPTANHNMLVKIMTANDDEGRWQMLSAGDMMAWKHDAAAAAWAQFRTNCPAGVKRAQLPLEQMPFAHALQLSTVDELDAFLELYGLWLSGAGSVDIARACVTFAPAKPQDVARLDALFSRLSQLPVESAIDAMGRPGFAITHPSWANFFAASAVQEEGAARWLTECLTATQMQVVLRGLGTTDTDGELFVVTSSPRLRDHVQLLALMAGYSTHVVVCQPSSSQQQPLRWSVQFTTHERHALPALDVRQQMKSITQSGTIWCVNVPTADHLIIARRVARSPVDAALLSASRPVLVGNSATGELIAVKQVRLTTAEEQEQAASIQNEIGLMENLRHPNIVSLLGTQRNGNKLNILMEYVPGKSLDSLLEKFGGFSEKVIRSYTKQLLEALSYCHANRVVHRDIKGKNILIDTKGNLKLADFGSAKRFTNVMSKDAPSLSYNYTPLWTAPEVLVGDYNSKVDIWSLGCVIIEMASAKPPWSEQNFENPFRALYHIGNSDAIPRIPDSLSEVGVAFVKQCLRRNPDERPDAATLLKQDWLSGIESLPNTSDDSASDGEEENGMKSGSESD